MKKIIVCYDFTEYSDYAMQYASIIGEAMQANITMLYVTEDSHQKMYYAQKLENEMAKYSYKHELKADVFVGEFNSTVRKYAEMNKAMLVIAGKKERSSIERIFGGKTIKLIMGATTPFIVVQAPPKTTNLSKILVPISFDSMNKAKLKWVQIFSQYFHLDVELLLQYSDNEYEQEDTRANFLFAKRYLDRFNIKRTETLAPNSIPFKEAVVKHGNKIDADLILIMTSGNASFIDYMIGTTEEYIIENNKRPVMCINPNLNMMRYQDFY